MFTIAFPDGLLAPFEVTEARARRQLETLTMTALSLHLTVPVTFELRRYADPAAEEFEVLDTVTAEPQGMAADG